MDTMDINTQSNRDESAIKQKLGQLGRKLKKVDVRESVVDYPFAAVGIAAAAGALIGLVRPKPEPGRISGAIITTLGMIGFRLVREAAVRELGQYAKNYVLNRQQQSSQESIGSQNVEGGSIRYSPTL